MGLIGKYSHSDLLVGYAIDLQSPTSLDEYPLDMNV